jgi:hypothetical protein
MTKAQIQTSFVDAACLASDVVHTPEWCVSDILAWFSPSGIILDPCRGLGAFHKFLPEGSPWCEIGEGKDFFQWSVPVDWCIGNPPYSMTPRWLRHTFSIAANAVYVLPIRNIFAGHGLIKEIYEYGGIAHMRFYGRGGALGFPFGNAVGAIHFQRGYQGPIGVSFWANGPI